MQLFLVHHGDALPPHVDFQRPLSPTGLARVGQVAQQAATDGANPAVVWHSGKLRARQTADAFRQACNPTAEFRAVKGLQPTDPPDRMADEMTAEASVAQARDIMLVGHMPNIHRLLCLLVEGTTEGTIQFPAHGIVALEYGDAGWVERWRLEG